MMKKNFSLIFSLVIAALVFGFVMPAAASTEGANRGNKAKAPIAKGICAAVNNLSDKIGQKMIDSGAKFEKKKADNNNALAERQGKRDSQLAANRANWNEKSDKQFVKLERRASSTAEKDAVTAFKTAMKTAIATRQAAVDKAVADYRAGLKDKMSARQVALDTAIVTYKAAQQTAFDKAKADCAANVDQKTANNTLKAALKAAQDKFKTDRQAIEKLGPNVEALTAAKKVAIDKAVSDFKVAAEKARIALKTAFGIVK
jgi:hypothetical protein